MSEKTPSNNRTRRKSSSHRKSLGGSTTGGSATKVVRLMIEKDKKRKLNHYQSAKLKRAEKFETHRGISEALAQPIDFERDPNITDDFDESLISLDVDSDVDNAARKNDSTKFDAGETTLRSEEAASEAVIVVEEKGTSGEQAPRVVTAIASRIGSSIASRLNLVKNSIRKMVSSTNRYTVTNESEMNQPKSSVVRSLNESSNVKLNKCVPTRPSIIPKCAQPPIQMPKPREVTGNKLYIQYKYSYTVVK